jgi:pimeloyl-ACP methyl ester carboxylesterase
MIVGSYVVRYTGCSVWRIMARVVVDGVGIYYEVVGHGPALVLQHGFADSLTSWYEHGYVDALAGEHQLVLIDARGHGHSDKPHDASSYSSDALPLDVLAVLDDLEVAQSAFFGHSMGGGIGLALAHYAPGRFTALAIGASAPDSRRSEDPSGILPLLEEGPPGILRAWQASVSLSPQMTQRLLAIDCEALTALLHGDRARRVTDAEALARFPGRYRFFMGELDWFYPDMIAALDQLAPGALVVYPGVNHLESFQRSDLILDGLRSFLANDR